MKYWRIKWMVLFGTLVFVKRIGLTSRFYHLHSLAPGPALSNWIVNVSNPWIRDFIRRSTLRIRFSGLSLGAEPLVEGEGEVGELVVGVADASMPFAVGSVVTWSRCWGMNNEEEFKLNSNRGRKVQRFRKLTMLPMRVSESFGQNRGDEKEATPSTRFSWDNEEIDKGRKSQISIQISRSKRFWP